MELNWNWKLKFGSVFIISLFLIGKNTFAATNTSYKSLFGACPTKAASQFALIIAKNFEETKSLRKIKEQIVNGQLQDKYFISNYGVKLDPIKNRVTIKLECPTPMYRITFYGDGLNSVKDHDDLILANNGNFYNKIFQEMLEEEGKAINKLPVLALPENRFGQELKGDLQSVSRRIYMTNFDKNLTEMIINRDETLTLILSINQKPISVFMGKQDWGAKIDKLTRIVDHFASQSRIPSIINITNVKKIVVKFSE